MQSITTNGAGSNASPVLEVEDSKSCEQCGTAFSPRSGKGGKPQRFCSPDCRLAFHSDAQRGQRSPTCSTLPAVVDPPYPKPSANEPGKEFDWADVHGETIAAQLETAIYWNPKGDLVIRQRSWPDDDSLIIISEASVDAFLDKLTDVCGIPSFGGPSK